MQMSFSFNVSLNCRKLLSVTILVVIIHGTGFRLLCTSVLFFSMLFFGYGTKTEYGLFAVHVAALRQSGGKNIPTYPGKKLDSYRVHRACDSPSTLLTSISPPKFRPIR